jgi:hypothetical protein
LSCNHLSQTKKKPTPQHSSCFAATNSLNQRKTAAPTQLNCCNQLSKQTRTTPQQFFCCNQLSKQTKAIPTTQFLCYNQCPKTNKNPPHNRIILLQPELQNKQKTTSEQNYFAATSSADLCRTPKLETIVQADETIKQQQGYEK